MALPGDAAGSDGMHIAFAQQGVGLGVQLHLGALLRIEKHAITDLDLTRIGAGGHHLTPGQASAHAGGGRDQDAPAEQSETPAEQTAPETPTAPDPDAGAKKALETERQARREADKAAKALKAELDARKSPSSRSALPHLHRA